MFPVLVLKMRTFPVKVVSTAPHTGPLSFALGTGVIRIPLLTLKALLDARGRGTLALLNNLHAFVVLIAKVHPPTKHLLLGFLIFKCDYYFENFCPFFFIEESHQMDHLDVVSLLQLSPESVIIKVWIDSRDYGLIFQFLILR